MAAGAVRCLFKTGLPYLTLPDLFSGVSMAVGREVFCCSAILSSSRLIRVEGDEEEVEEEEEEEEEEDDDDDGAGEEEEDIFKPFATYDSRIFRRRSNILGKEIESPRSVLTTEVAMRSYI